MAEVYLGRSIKSIFTKNRLSPLNSVLLMITLMRLCPYWNVTLSLGPLTVIVELAEVCEVVIELYYQEVRLVLGNIYANMPSAYPRD